ncbi:unnamed protein product [Adineta ricciae]|uniref:Uncharacterized protein n=1 Tax=Adineta ricciae TaxID=249248 RepID=A0A813UFT0_ADIRI|nr:unnamed protein product [Adineta ricciae]
MSAIISITFSLLICYVTLLPINGLPVMSMGDIISDKEIFVRPKTIDQAVDKIIEDNSLSLPDIRRRNVLMPRICYFSRVTATGIHQKLCLPYNDKR